MEQNTSLEWALGLTFIEFFGDYGAKTQYVPLTFAGYNTLAFALFQAMKTNDLIIVNSYWDGISNVMTTLLGYMMGERPSTMQWIGIGLITGGIVALRMG